MAQGVTIDKAGELDSVEVYLGGKEGTGGANYTITIFNDSSGVPGSAISNAATITSSAVQAAFGWFTYTFSTKPTITNGQKVWIVISRGSADNINYIKWGINTSGGYSGGGFFYKQGGTTWTVYGSYDANFKEYCNISATSRINLLLMGVG